MEASHPVGIYYSSLKGIGFQAIKCILEGLIWLMSLGKHRMNTVKFLLLSAAVFFNSGILAQPPSISTIIPSSAVTGTQVIISGNNFSPVVTNNIVYFGPAKAQVVSASPTSLTAIVPAGATYDRVRVVANGFSAYSSKPFGIVSGIPGTHSFVMMKQFAAGSYPTMLARGDLDGDGKPDMVVSNFQSASITVYRNISVAGTVDFTPGIDLATGGSPEGVVIDDINSDGKPDIVVTSIDDHLFSVFVNTGTGPGTLMFALRQDIVGAPSFSPRGVITGDVDGDGRTDVITADNNKQIDFATNTGYGTFSVFRNTGTGTAISFAAPQSFQMGEYPRAVSIGDLDNDGKPDLAISAHVSENISVFRNASTPGNINFTLQQTLPLDGRGERVQIRDIDNDGKADILATYLFNTAGYALFLNTSTTGSISLITTNYGGSLAGTLGLCLGDMTADGRPELVMTNTANNKAMSFRNTTSIAGSWPYSARTEYDAGIGPLDILIGDVDMDMLPDLTISNGSVNMVTVLRMSVGYIALNLPNEMSLCEGEELEITADIGVSAQFQWNTGSTSKTIRVSQPGKYWVNASTTYGSFSDTVFVTQKPNPSVDLGSDIVLCQGETKVLDVTNPGATYSWSSGVTLPSITVSAAGTYFVTVDMDGCKRKDTVVIDYKVAPHFTLGPDAILCKDRNILLKPVIDNAQLVWQDGSDGQNFLVTRPGIYQLTASNECGSFTDQVRIESGSCELYMPNAFTPDNDGKNDVFGVKYFHFIREFDMKIYNRWGEIVFQTKNPSQAWPGKYKGIEQPAGSYAWIIRLTDTYGASSVHNGTVLLIR